jgi:hypothetical protein
MRFMKKLTEWVDMFDTLRPLKTKGAFKNAAYSESVV